MAAFIPGNVALLLLLQVIFATCRVNLRVQVKIDALVCSDVPLQREHHLPGLPQIPAEDLWILVAQGRRIQSQL